MKTDLRILHLEDDPMDAELVQQVLASDVVTCEVTRVETEADFIASLERCDFDLILADYTLPTFDGLSALKIARENCPLVPFIFVSGTIDEDLAIEALKIGATDYVFKTRMSRILPSVKRALREARERAELSRADEALRRSEAYLAEAQRLSHTGSVGWDFSTGELYWSQETFRIYEYEAATKVTLELAVQRTHPDDSAAVQQLIERALRDREAFDMEHRLLMPDGSVKYLHVVGRPSTDERGNIEFVGAVTDITERKRGEEALQKALAEIQELKDQLQKENIILREEIGRTSMFEDIVGTSAPLRSILTHVSKVAPTESTVLITGETGTGKELVARAIHKRSPRSARPFVSVNCAAIPATLIASELFGHEKGAFTGAVQRQQGRFELAEGGTIFLDEVGELPLEIQVTLLRVLQEREFERVGGVRPIRANVRVIAATNRDLETAIADNTFRSDLFYRLNVFPLVVPPLRERPEDIPLLVRYFTQRFAQRAGKRIDRISKKTLSLLQSYDWPGNVRELNNVVERAVIVSQSDVLSVDQKWLVGRKAKPRAVAPTIHAGQSRTLATRVKEVIEAALMESRGRVSGPFGAASLLGIPSSTLESKIKALKIDKQRFKQQQ